MRASEELNVRMSEKAVQLSEWLSGWVSVEGRELV